MQNSCMVCNTISTYISCFRIIQNLFEGYFPQMASCIQQIFMLKRWKVTYWIIFDLLFMKNVIHVWVQKMRIGIQYFQFLAVLKIHIILSQKSWSISWKHFSLLMIIIVIKINHHRVLVITSFYLWYLPITKSK